jgi:hypothetical protein
MLCDEVGNRLPPVKLPLLLLLFIRSEYNSDTALVHFVCDYSLHKLHRQVQKTLCY